MVMMMDYNLSELVNSDKDIELPAIVERLSSQREYRKVLRRVLKQTGDELRESLLVLYAASLQDDDDTTAEALLLVVLWSLNRATKTAIQEATALILSEAGYLDSRFIAGVKRVTGFDVTGFVRPDDTRKMVASIVERNAALITDLSEQTRSKITQAVIDAQIKGLSKAQLKDELSKILGKQAKRADLIASDQMEKLAADIIADRAKQANLNIYIWQSRHDDRVRSYHQYLDGKRQDTRNASHGDHGLFPRQPIRCRCRAKWIIGGRGTKLY